ncbi:malate dehydrogenase [Imhoffiella purpurea]|uniref:Malate dehydrogenase n=1 Tax=Imhoffiella purpurea TaxID=1249627 RepID=W9VBX8_9GAMM|nr:malate dehydrogenase [Imhoffiella purpurea]EXJ17093.1 Malate dehydrogenase [Imhoffiella purpurea]
MKKITIVGAGRVGETTAQILAEAELCREVALFDVREGVPEGIALDILQTAPFFEFDSVVHGSNDPRILKDSELVVVTAGLPRKPGMSRADVLESNVRIIDEVTDHIIAYAPDALVLMVSNPVDTLTYRVAQRTGWNQSRVFGQAGVLDASRMASFIAQETGFSARDITTMVLGGHGDTMVPVPRFCTINGIPLSYFLPEDRIEAINERTRKGGAEILSLRKNSSAYDAPGAAVATMVDSIVNNRRRLLPCVALLEGEYGEADIAMGVPCILGSKGVESIVELDLNERERTDFSRSASAVRNEIERLGDIGLDTNKQ